MNLKCVFGHDTMSQIVDQPNKKVIKIRMYCPRCGKEDGMLTWPNPAFAAEYAEGIFEMPYDDDQGCTVPPPGWYCTRKPGHDGSCAAKPTTLK